MHPKGQIRTNDDDFSMFDELKLLFASLGINVHDEFWEQKSGVQFSFHTDTVIKQEMMDFTYEDNNNLGLFDNVENLESNLKYEVDDKLKVELKEDPDYTPSGQTQPKVKKKKMGLIKGKKKNSGVKKVKKKISDPSEAKPKRLERIRKTADEISPKYIRKFERCDYCDKMLVKKTNKKWEEHILKHKLNDPNATFECKICKTEFKVYASLKEHEKTHEGEVYSCQECPKQFTDFKKYTTHLRQHKVKKEESLCDLCGKTFVNKYHVESHKKSAHFVSEVTCHVCGKVSKNREAQRKHYNRNHRHKIYCEYCNREYHSNTALKRHIISSHLAHDQRPFQCKICGKGFGRQIFYNDHMNIHYNIKNFHCDLCDYKCVTKVNRDKHERQVHKYFREKKEEKVET